MQQLRKKYGYKFYNCTIEEWKHNFQENYNVRKNRTVQEKVPFEFVKFESVKQGIELIKNSAEEIKQLAIEAAKRHRKEWADNEGDKLQERFMKIFPSKKVFNSIISHGEINGRIGSDFLKKNQWWLN